MLLQLQNLSSMLLLHFSVAAVTAVNVAAVTVIIFAAVAVVNDAAVAVISIIAVVQLERKTPRLVSLLVCIDTINH